MKKIRVAINGFGRIGRAFFRAANERDELDIVAVNDLGELENLAYLLRYDSVYGKSPFTIVVKTDPLAFIINDSHEIAFLSKSDPTQLPWKEMDVDVVVEATGVFAGYEKSQPHLVAGAKRVVITAPVKDEPPEGVNGATVLMGVNDQDLKTCDISSNASCTTNAASPLLQILHEAVGIEKALLTTVHGYTATQALVDSPEGKDFRRGRAAAVNIIPASTGAAIATTKAIPDLKERFDGIAMRVPVVAGSIADITFIAKEPTTADRVNGILEDAALQDRWKKVFSVTKEPIVSTDILGSPYASIADLSMTRVVGGTLVKVLSWYDNEMGYTYALVEHVITTGGYVT